MLKIELWFLQKVVYSFIEDLKKRKLQQVPVSYGHYFAFCWDRQSAFHYGYAENSLSTQMKDE